MNTHAIRTTIFTASLINPIWFAAAALLIPAPMVFAQSTSTAPAAKSELTEIDAEIDRLIEAADVAGENPIESMKASAEQLHALAGHIEQYLHAGMDKANWDRLTLARWEAIYLSATIRGEGLDEIANELGDALNENPSPQLRDAAEYWRLRISLNYVRSEQALGRMNESDAVRIMTRFLKAHPTSAYAVPLAEKILYGLYEVGDLTEAEACIQILEKHHSKNVMTKTLAGRYRLHRAVGQTWRPVLMGLDHRPTDWTLESGMPTLVIFWSPSHGPSRRMLQIAQGLQSKRGIDRFRVVTIAVHKDVAAILRELETLGVSFPTACEREAWQSRLVNEFGIRTLPMVFMLDRKGRLASFFEPRGWEMKADFEGAVAGLLDGPESQPVERPPTPGASTTAPGV
ncbi:MAG: hypothetical protein IPK83_01395 [Planctomycetes bacterium]|nr:hypothetical protein [Planctomycetota bacterium]